MTTVRNFNSEEKAKLTAIIREGTTVLQEMEDLNAGLTDTIKALAEEMQIKPSVLKKAINIAHKGAFAQYNDDWSITEDILRATGKISEGDA